MANVFANARTLVLKGGQVVTGEGIRKADVVVEGEHIAAVGSNLAVPPGARVLESGGCLVGPGLVDLHTHLRQPGREEAETIASGSRAAVLGGYTTVVAMPNTTPALDSVDIVQDVYALAAEAACHLKVAGAITVGRQGERLTPLADLASLGVRMFTDDGDCVADTGLMRMAMEQAGRLGVRMSQHAEDPGLVGDGVLNEGLVAKELGLPGRMAEAEELIVFRDIALARKTGTALHFQHLSTAGSVELVRRAKAEGVQVTAEACPHHFTLTEAACLGLDPNTKVNPPLRTEVDRLAVIEGLRDGTIDAIATDHAPHTPESKSGPFAKSPSGMLGLQTALALSFDTLGLPAERIWALASWQPSAIYGPDTPVFGLTKGAVADLCVYDPTVTWVLDASTLASKSQNTPWLGRAITGRVRHTLVAGDPVVIDAELAC